MTLSLISAIGTNNELGKDNLLLWDLPRDMKHFRETTKGHPVLMGRKTFESIGRPLPNRRNIIITRDTNYTKEGIEVVHSIEEAIQLFKNSAEEVFIIGGAEIYKEALPFANRLYLTHVDGSFDADAFFPEVNYSEWREISREHFDKDEENNYPCDFVVYEK